MNRRVWTLSALSAAALLAGCAGLTQLTSDVASYGEWPAGRQPGSYAIERLPSQQNRADIQDQLESAARPGLEAAGFKPAEAGKEPDVVVQLGARVTRTDASPWDDPLWWRGGFGTWRYGPWPGPRWSVWAQHEFPRFEREVAVLIRDRSSGKPLYEARATSDGTSTGGTAVLRAMYDAAMKDFPATGPNPRRVTTALPQ
jgi:hypothetical protein